jgi:carnitine O-acetyltransferase
VLAYEGIGADVLKGAKVSPDAAIQMTLQLAYFLTHGESTPTYETASTRQFAHGRTETIRTLTAKTRRLCERWHAASVTLAGRLKALPVQGI